MTTHLYSKIINYSKISNPWFGGNDITIIWANRLFEAFMWPEDYHFARSVITTFPCLSKAGCRHHTHADTGKEPIPRWLSEHTHTHHGHHLIGNSYCNRNERAREQDTQRQQLPVGLRQSWWLKWHLLLMRKNHSWCLGRAPRSGLHLHLPGPRQPLPPPAGLSIHWFSIFHRPPSCRLLWALLPQSQSDGSRKGREQLHR